MRVTVDRSHCAGNGVCESIAPEFFEIGRDGVMVLLRETIQDEGEAEKIAEAVRSCPALALDIVEE
jgi:ferredoxin